ncbi:MAG: hypothetical protein ACYS0G_01000 [Planctomycetota bacterium]|jgi:hypothetical protein
MNIDTFLGHYGISENPFRAEEARQDAVFERVETICRHPDFDKIRGDFERSSTSIVFGERGSGKTAIRLQIEHALREHNRDHPDARCLPLIYDELNPVLDRFGRRVRSGSPLEIIRRFQLVDHVDAMLNAVVPRIVTRILGEESGRNEADAFDVDAPRRARQLDAHLKRELMMLQICYDRPEDASLRSVRLQRALKLRSPNRVRLLKWLTGIMGGASLAVLIFHLIRSPQPQAWLWTTLIVLLLLVTAGLGGRLAWLWLQTERLARDLSRRLRILDRPPASFRASLVVVSTEDTLTANLPRTDDDDLRYAMFARLLRVVRPFGYRSIMVLVDRVDEPTLINGEPQRMRAFVWPMLNNKFLQQDQIGVKLLLPLELKHLLSRETGEFFREARLDKQNLIERLTWTGATLYDLCTARLNACRPTGDSPMSLTDMFDGSVTPQDLVDSLDQLQQPRDAFKFLYQLIQEHCRNVPEEQPQWRVPRPILDSVRRAQVDRMTGMLRGERPA